MLMGGAVALCEAEESDTVRYTTAADSCHESGGWYESGSLFGADGNKTRVASAGDAVYVEWRLAAVGAGIYRISFYNVLHRSNTENITATVFAGESTESKDFSHKGAYEDSSDVVIGIYELDEGDELCVRLSAKEGGNIRADSIVTEYFPCFEENVYDSSAFRELSGEWYASSLVGYNGLGSRYGISAPDGYWSIGLKNEGILDLYVYNLQNAGNGETIKATVCDSNGEKHIIEIAHRDTADGLVFLGRYEYLPNGRAYVELCNEGGGYLRINALVARLHSKTAAPNEADDYPQRKLTAQEAPIYTPTENARVIYVSPEGENGNGSREEPLNCISAAQEAVRKIISDGYPEGGVVVRLLDGTYKTDTLTLTAKDSGTEEAPVLWCSDGGAVITTAEEIPITDFYKPKDTDILARIPQGARSRVLCADISRLELDKMNISSPYAVSFDDTPGTLSRFPNSGFSRSGDLADIGTRSDSGKRQRGFTYRINDLRALLWAEEPNGYLSGYWMTPYTMDTVKIAEADSDKMTITAAAGTGLGAYENARYRALNMLCELDSEGEWYIEDGILYVIAPKDCQNVYISCAGNGILNFSGAHSIIFKNISFKNCVGTAVSFVNNSADCAIVGGSVKNTTGGGIALGGYGCFVRDADISHTGGFGIDINGGDEYVLLQGGNYAENNTVTKCGRYMTQKSAVTVRGCGNRASNNHIYDVPTHGIVGAGMENIIEKNIIERTNLEMGDTGGIYFENYGMGYGSKIRWNIVKDSVGLSPQYGFTDEGALGIYIDDLTSGIEVYGNVVYNAEEPGTFVHSGRYNNIHNNIYIGCDTPIKVIKTGIAKGIAEGGAVWTNILKYDLDIIDQKYPEARESLQNLGDPVGNRVVNNISFSGGKSDYREALSAYSGTYSGNVDFIGLPSSELTDFYDFDYSEILEKCPDFTPIPFEQIGTYTGGARTNTEDVIFDNSCKPFGLMYPENGAENVECDVTLRWENEGGVKKSTVSISENEDMSDAEQYQTSESFLELSLEPGKTYYWCVTNEPLLGYRARQNKEGTASFGTVSEADKFESAKLSAEALIALADETEFAPEAVSILSAELATAENSEAAERAISDFLGKRKPTNELDTVIFDDYSSDKVGDKPFGLFLRSNSPLDVTVREHNGDKCVKFNDDGENCHYAARYFYPEKRRAELSTRVTPMQNTGKLSVSITAARTHATRDGTSAGNAARVIFDSDGIIYGDKAKQYPLMSYSAGESYDVKISLDVAGKKYSVYINNVKKAENIPIGADCGEVGAVLYDTGDGTAEGFAAAGVFYVDDTILRVPRSYGTGAELTELWINEEKTEVRDVVNAGAGDGAAVRCSAPKNAHTLMRKKDGRVYITVISGDFDRVKTYVIK